MELINKEVHFDRYCKICRYAKLAEDEDPCNECLACPSNEYTHRPVKFEEVAKSEQRNERIDRAKGCNR